jgi:hypothetical protein
VLLGPVTGVYAEWRLRDSGRDDDVFVALTHGAAPGRTCGAAGARARPATGSASPAPRAPTSSAGRWTARRTRCSPGTRRPRWATGGAPSPRSAGAACAAATRARWCPPSAAAGDFFYPAFAAAVRGTGPVPSTRRTPWPTAAVLDAARRSATGGGVVEP